MMKQSMAVKALAALAHDTRIAVFRLLVQAGPGGLAAGSIGGELEIPAPTLSFHLKELKQAGLVRAERDGRTQIYRANYMAMDDLLTFLTDKCCEGVATGSAPKLEQAAQQAALHER